MTARLDVIIFTTQARPASRSVRHPLGTRARVLLSSVFGPYAQDDEFGSRKINPMELWHNQVTRVQGPFSVRMFHRSWGLMLMQANMEAPCTCLDFPTLDRFIAELKENSYDIIGLSGIVANSGKIQKMCALVRQYQPQATLVVGGHVAGIPHLGERIDADHIVRGDGVRWFRPVSRRGRKPTHEVSAGLLGHRRAGHGLRLPQRQEVRFGRLDSLVGCPMGCNFCCTSALFGGKGNSVSFWESGDELFSIMSTMEKEMGVQAFFVMDENFLLHRSRALRLLELMREHDKAWALYSSANALRQYTADELVELGLSWLWIGLEGKNSQYNKTAGVDTHKLVRELQEQGTRVLGSTIIGLEAHTPENIDDAIAHAVSHETDFHQFMLYMAMAGTPLWHEMTDKGVMRTRTRCPKPTCTANTSSITATPASRREKKPTFYCAPFTRTSALTARASCAWCGPHYAATRNTRTTPTAVYAAVSNGKCKASVRPMPARCGRPSVGSPTTSHSSPSSTPFCAIHAEFGIFSRLVTPILGRVVLRALRREQKRIDSGKTFEPPTFYESNFDPPVNARHDLRKQKWTATTSN